MLEGKNAATQKLSIEGTLDGLNCSFKAALCYEEGYEEHLVTFANNITTHEGGVHREAFLSAIVKAIIEVGEKEKLLKGFGGKVKKSDCIEGLCAAVCVYLKQPEFEGQTKTKLGNPEIRQPLEAAFYESIKDYFAKNKQDAIVIATKIIDALKARDAARKAKDATRKKGGLDHFTLQGKLTPCSSKTPEECELFLCEGDSAAGSMIKARNRRTQAILPFRGKVINAEKHIINRILENKEIRSLITALKVSPSRSGIVDELEKLRYHKVVLTADSDSDGAHICCLMIVFFYRFMRNLIEEGHLYVSLPPLYRVQTGKKSFYLQNDEELQDFKEANPNAKLDVTRFKGLGEMNPEHIEETVLNPETRKLLRVTIDDVAEAAKTVNFTMGNDIDNRKKFLFEELDMTDMLI